MGSIRRFGMAIVLAGALAGGLSTASLEAKGKSGGDGQAAICTYLWSVITYPNVSPAILVYALSLYTNVYHCTAQ